MDGSQNVQQELSKIKTRLVLMDKKLDLLLQRMGITDLAAHGIDVSGEESIGTAILEHQSMTDGEPDAAAFNPPPVAFNAARTAGPGKEPQDELQDEPQEGKYTYQPLDHSKSEIRLLHLQYAPNFSDPIVAKLVVSSLDDPYQNDPHLQGYKALSYTWGPPVFDGSVTLDGYQFPVTKNLETALRYMRKVDPDYFAIPGYEQSVSMRPTYYWWIDQICINQQDIEERGEQVGLMRRIYKRASSISVWLGEESSDSSRAMDLMTAIGKPRANAPGEKQIQYPKLTADEVRKNWQALRNLMNRPWWERVWIRQEVALSDTVRLFVGERWCDMYVIKPALEVIHYLQKLGFNMLKEREFENWTGEVGTGYSSDDERLQYPWEQDGEGESTGSAEKEMNKWAQLPWGYHARQLQKLRSLTQGGHAWVLLEKLLPTARGCKATNPLDSVYSVLGLCNPDFYPLTPNYHASLTTVLVDATRAILTSKDPQGNPEYVLDILAACQNVDRRLSLPSWVPNLVEDWKAMPFSVTESQFGQRNRDLRVTHANASYIDIDGECLTLKGGHIDEVNHLCDTLVPSTATVPDLESIYQLWKDWVDDRASILHHNEYIGFRKKKPWKEKLRQWIQFLTILSDQAEDLNSYSNDYPEPTEKHKKQGPEAPTIELTTAGLVDLQIQAGNDLRTQYNLRLSLCHRLPSTLKTLSLHPHHRIHQGLRQNGPGRKLCITKRGFVALVPGESEKGDSIAAIQGASFAYVLRRLGATQSNALVGEAFIPRWIRGMGEDSAAGFGKSVQELIQIC